MTISLLCVVNRLGNIIDKKLICRRKHIAGCFSIHWTHVWNFTPFVTRSSISVTSANAITNHAYDILSFFMYRSAVLLFSRPGLGLEDRGHLIKALALDDKVLALAPQVLALALALAKTFSLRSRPRGCCTCMLCSHSLCHITVCHFLLRNVSQTCMYIWCRL